MQDHPLCVLDAILGKANLYGKHAKIAYPALLASPASHTHGGGLCIISLTAPCGEHVNTGFADACPVETMQD
jgi:hypothetical protein